MSSGRRTAVLIQVVGQKSGRVHAVRDAGQSPVRLVRDFRVPERDGPRAVHVVACPGGADGRLRAASSEPERRPRWSSGRAGRGRPIHHASARASTEGDVRKTERVVYARTA